MSKWISVEDRLPEEKGYYKIRAIWGSLTITEREENAYFTGKRFRYGFDWCKVTHWQPLSPQPEVGE